MAEEALCCGYSVAAVECESVAEALEELPDTREVDSTDGDTANEPVVARKTINNHRDRRVRPPCCDHTFHQVLSELLVL